MGILSIFKKKQVKRASVKREEENGEKEELLEKVDKYNDNFINLNKEIEELIIREVLNVVKYHDKFEELKIRAKIASHNIGEEHINLLPEYLACKIEKPDELKGKYEELGEWPMVVENSILMIIFSYKESGVDILTKIAYGNTSLQLKAINILVRLAKEEVSTEKIIDDIMNNIIKFNDMDKIVILGFASQIKGNNKIIALIQHFYKEFLKDGNVESAYETLVHLINAAQRCTTGHLSFLKFLAMDSEKIDLKKVIDIKEGDKDFIDVININEFTKIRATLTFYNMNQEDKDINNNLIYLSKNYRDEEVRNEIKRLFESKKCKI
ncbi:hypothetical protein KPL40_03275 [Clostridium gasigenes]|uniref:hypothetical protein n=1 Tax=Clostridium gasigenes TaxID=94869 RepID=UPI001C0E0691|nr:hypothetical protein [Clostridium gasigenes]MBU3131460.1 hypothetical protein [Clostridium gasigenes]